MNKKNRIYIVAVVVLAIIAVILIFSNSNSTFRRESSNFAVDDTANVTKIFMSDKNNNTLTLARKDVGNWIVNDKYAAQKFNIQMILSTILQLEVKSPVAKAARNNIIKDMATNGVKVEIYQEKYRIDLGFLKLFPHEKLTKVYYVGPATQDNRGTFMIMEHADQPYIVYMPGLRGFVSSRYTPIEKYWRDYNIFRKNIPEIKSVKVEYPQTPSESFEIVNNGNRNFVFKAVPEGTSIPVNDTIKLMSYLSGFRNINYEVLLNDIQKSTRDSIFSLPQFCIISLTDTSNVVTRIVTMRKPPVEGAVDETGKPLPFDMDRLYVVMNDGKDVTLAQYFMMDKLLRGRTWFLKPGTPEEQ